jgi:hypothetical protein
MKFVFLAGGFAGFLTAGITGWSSDHSAQRTLLDAAIGCLVGAMLFRWFWTVLVGGIRETLVLRHAAATAAAAAAESASASAKTK